MDKLFFISFRNADDDSYRIQAVISGKRDNISVRLFSFCSCMNKLGVKLSSDMVAINKPKIKNYK